jgi:RNA polymerase sigma-70 factor, ECF subfamily
METFEDYRPLLFGIAYRMLGSVMEAEDIVQEAYLRYRAAPPENVRSLRAYLSTIVTRLCLDQIKSARQQREHYVGPWLPEPLLTDEGIVPAPLQRITDLESISLAFLVLLENLSPLERAVFLLREVFDYPYAEIAEMLDRDEAACRQLFSRARKHLAENRPRFQSTPENHEQMLGKFLLAVQAGEMEGLMSLLTDEVTVWSDGGGRVTAATRPVQGRGKVAHYFLSLAKKAPEDTSIEIAPVNGKPALIIRVGGAIFAVVDFEIDAGLIREVRVIVNPEKLAHLT